MSHWSALHVFCLAGNFQLVIQGEAATTILLMKRGRSVITRQCVGLAAASGSHTHAHGHEHAQPAGVHEHEHGDRLVAAAFDPQRSFRAFGVTAAGELVVLVVPSGVAAHQCRVSRVQGAKGAPCGAAFGVWAWCKTGCRSGWQHMSAGWSGCGYTVGRDVIRRDSMYLQDATGEQAWHTCDRKYSPPPDLNFVFLVCPVYVILPRSCRSTSASHWAFPPAMFTL